MTCDMAGKAANEGSGRVERERARYNGATGVSNMAAGLGSRPRRSLTVERSGKLPSYNSRRS